MIKIPMYFIRRIMNLNKYTINNIRWHYELQVVVRITEWRDASTSQHAQQEGGRASDLFFHILIYLIT